MGYLEIDNIIWNIKKRLMEKHGTDESSRIIAPLTWYINTGRATVEFLKRLRDAKTFLIVRDLEKGGSYEETINRIYNRLKLERGVV